MAAALVAAFLCTGAQAAGQDGPAMDGEYEAVPGDAAASDAAAQPGAEDPQFHALFMRWKGTDSFNQMGAPIAPVPGSVSVPSLQPVSLSSVTFTSGFGVRSDPFHHSSAMHAGIDMAGPVGTPIYATADGIVSRAGWGNGYGNMVQISHGQGIETRYGHLSRILVSANSRVHRGEMIALMGSTGRSTGSHLHYEVRIDGRAVNPMPYLHSAQYLASFEKRGSANTQLAQIALAGPAD